MRPIRTTRSRGSSSPISRACSSNSESAPIRSAVDAYIRVEGIVHRYPDRVLLEARPCVPGLLPASATGRRWWAPPPTVALRGRARRRARLHRGASGDLGGDPHRRRSAGALGAPAARGRVADRSHRATSRDAGAVHAVPVAAPRASRRDWCAPCAPGKATYVVLHANHARELTPAARAACARLDRCRHPDAEPDRAAAGVNDDPETLGNFAARWSENRIKPYCLIMAIWRPAPRICAPRSHRGRR